MFAEWCRSSAQLLLYMKHQAYNILVFPPVFSDTPEGGSIGNGGVIVEGIQARVRNHAFGASTCGEGLLIVDEGAFFLLRAKTNVMLYSGLPAPGENEKTGLDEKWRLPCIVE